MQANFEKDAVNRQAHRAIFAREILLANGGWRKVVTLHRELAGQSADRDLVAAFYLGTTGNQCLRRRTEYPEDLPTGTLGEVIESAVRSNLKVDRAGDYRTDAEKLFPLYLLFALSPRRPRDQPYANRQCLCNKQARECQV